MDQIRGEDVRLIRSAGSADVDTLFVLASQSALAQNQTQLSQLISARFRIKSRGVGSGDCPTRSLHRWLGARAQADAREVAPLCLAALRACPCLSDIERARLSDERLVVPVASCVCGSCRERFAAQRVGEEVSSDVSLCTSYQS